MGVIAVVVIGIVVGGIAADRVLLRSLPNGWTWDKVTWRAKLFVRKAEGHVPDLSWRELWYMIHVRGGFGLSGFVTSGFSVEGSVLNSLSSPADIQNGAKIFQARCAVCHGARGAGGFGPALNHVGLRHGDSDLALYKVVRDGIPRTPMAPVPMSNQERWQLIGYLRSLLVPQASQQTQQLPSATVEVTSDEIRSAGSHTDQWLTYSGSLDGHRYTSLNEITPENVSRLRVRWIYQFDTTTESARSESTPLVSGGVIFLTEPPSNVVALDARSGLVRWRYNRPVPDRLPVCCARTNRGLAILGNVLFLGSLDCYLVAIDATTGNVIWQNQVCSSSDGYSMTGAPLIVNDSVVVGVAGGEYGIRGFLAAFDVKTGHQKWKFFTIPGPGETGHESWKNGAWRSGGGPTWVTGSYDPLLNLIYWGVGNPAPGFQGDVRPGDDLFTDSLLALDANTGKLAWYFQFTPHDQHDWDATQTPILADIRVKGILRRVVCVANRNGFYYVLDRTNGQFLLGVPFMAQNWAKGLDSAGRPILTADAEISSSGRATSPGVGGGINWQNTAFDPRNDVVFIPATEGASVYTKSEKPERGDLGFYPGSSGGDYVVPQERVVRAFDAATGAQKWERRERSLPPWQKSQGSNGYSYSGLLATGGNLVFGGSGGFIFAIDSRSGHEMWRFSPGGDTYAAPISFSLNGHQVIVVSAGQALFMFGL